VNKVIVSNGMEDALGMEESPMDDMSPASMLEKVLAKLHGIEVALGISEDSEEVDEFNSDSA